ncbi:MAG: DinB family protein [Pseudomonadota bacterium]
MITPTIVVAMARHSRWQNAQFFASASALSDAQRRADEGLFFGSLHATMSHLLWGDQIWLSRFANTPAPPVDSIGQSVTMIDAWEDLQAARLKTDQQTTQWAAHVDSAWLNGELTWYSGSQGRDVTRPTWLLVMHMFNHQTHHRGQIHGVLTRYGAPPLTSDIPFVPDDA